MKIEEPDCKTCVWCAWWKKRNGRIIEVECMKNPNLGAVSIHYHDKCRDYHESNLHVDDAARSSPQTRDNGIHQEE